MSKILFIVLLLFVSGACTESQVDYRNNLDYPQRNIDIDFLHAPTNITAGGEMYHDNCAQCHGKLSEGRSPKASRFDPPPSDFTSSNYVNADPAYIFWRIATGKQEEPFYSQGSVMPAWRAHYTDEQIWQLVAYLRSISVQL